MARKNFWSGGVGIKGMIVVALTSLVIGLGISGSLDWLVPSRAINMLGDAYLGRTLGADLQQRGNADPSHPFAGCYRCRGRGAAGAG